MPVGPRPKLKQVRPKGRYNIDLDDVKTQDNSRKLQKLKLLSCPVPPSRLTARQIIYAQGKAAGLTTHEAARAAGYSEKSHNWTDLEKNANLQSYMRQIAGQEGITPSLIMSTLFDGMTAVGVKEFCSKDGFLVEGKPRADTPSRLEATKIAAGLLGLEPPKHAEDVSKVENVNILVLAEKYKDMSTERLLEVMQQIKTGQVTTKNLDEQIPELQDVIL